MYLRSRLVIRQTIRELVNTAPESTDPPSCHVTVIVTKAHCVGQ